MGIKGDESKKLQIFPPVFNLLTTSQTDIKSLLDGIFLAIVDKGEKRKRTNGDHSWRGNKGRNRKEDIEDKDDDPKADACNLVNLACNKHSEEVVTLRVELSLRVQFSLLSNVNLRSSSNSSYENIAGAQPAKRVVAQGMQTVRVV
ncbi:hypothetical protein POM88_007595 [Heracleum sosnowskyi]|uniref:Uncharacterized protein n=1 Tax=Heracleum sosnowskyi TaxID=360622 RepID=A0AAD8J4V6_9APIA|nr:hypothetical protein POM88_007595 [Heracleum sosnowskyi]